MIFIIDKQAAKIFGYLFLPVRVTVAMGRDV